MALSLGTGRQNEKSGVKSCCKCSLRLSKNRTDANGGLSFAGSDTSAAAIRATLLYVVANSCVQSALLEEIRNSPISAPITDAEARKLPYLQVVIKEGLRIYPPATGLMLKEVPPADDSIKAFMCPEARASDGLHMA